MVRVWVLLAVLLTPAVAQAESAVRVVVLPFVTTDDELAIYGKPVADAIATRLADVKGVVVRSAGAGDAGAELIVELRVTPEKKKLRLEALLRDPQTGETVAVVAARPVALAHLDRSAINVAKKLSPKLEAAAARPRAAVPTATVNPPPDPTPNPIRPDPIATPDPRPLLAVRPPDSAVAAASLGHFVESLGYRPVPASADARTSIMMDVVDVDLDKGAVMTARGTVRIRLFDATGRAFFDRTVDTDTVVGSRGDRADAVVGFMLRQAFDMVARDVKRALP